MTVHTNKGIFKPTSSETVQEKIFITNCTLNEIDEWIFSKRILQTLRKNAYVIENVSFSFGYL